MQFLNHPPPTSTLKPLLPPSQLSPSYLCPDLFHTISLSQRRCVWGFVDSVKVHCDTKGDRNLICPSIAPAHRTTPSIYLVGDIQLRQVPCCRRVKQRSNCHGDQTVNSDARHRLSLPSENSLLITQLPTTGSDRDQGCNKLSQPTVISDNKFS